ncbi:Gfo/Idh/MocA family protein [Klenkia brasiliensis]|uniref:Predicted dehydrogenase n=1 Tax=Klenkia brasiliensis TaxID=333142 RepID=A0A1G7YST9_9ACTN|nr:Gfo/Idh/MocA family oxidoreductase [Klenkia brasiliensis]SDG99269.1 Predicted dehydrogenase [Klenkia brasiliensis]
MSVRVGLVGAGAVGARHARVLAGFADVELLGIADPVPGAARALADSTGAPVVPVAELLAARPDGVWLCVPPFAHGELEVQVVAAEVPFFTEKPLAADLATAVQVAALVAASGLPTATGYHWRHLDTVAAARAELAGRVPRLVAARWWGGTPPPAWWRDPARSGGQLVEQATHVLDLVRVLAGEVDEVVGAAAASTHDDRGVPDATAAVLRMASGAVGSVSTSCVLPGPTAAGLDVVADDLVVQLTETSLSVRDRGRDEQRTPAVDPRVAVDRAFVDVLAGGVPAAGLVDVAEALRTHRLAWALAEATRTGSTVRVAR